MTTVYWGGGEDGSYAGLYNCGFSATSQTRWVRSAYARGGILMAYGYASTANPPTCRAVSWPFGPISTLWVHGQFGGDVAGSASVPNLAAIRLLDNTGVARIVIRSADGAGRFKVSTCNAAGTYADIATSAGNIIPSSHGTATWAYDLFVNYASAGQVKLYIAGVSVLDTGAGVNLLTDSCTALAQADYGFFTYNTSEEVYWSEPIIQDTTTLGCAMLTNPPLAAGNTQSWSGAVGNINEVPANDSTGISSVTVGALSEWTVNTALPTGAWAIEAQILEARLSVGTTGPQHIGMVVRTSDGSDHVTGTIAATVTLTNYQAIVATNPHTGAAWNAGELINIGLEALT